VSTGSPAPNTIEIDRGFIWGLACIVTAIVVAFLVARNPSPPPAATPAPAVAPAKPLAPYTATCPWCGRPISVDPNRPTGDSIGKVIGATK
jgi:hypothetical protein